MSETEITLPDVNPEEEDEGFDLFDNDITNDATFDDLNQTFKGDDNLDNLEFKKVRRGVRKNKGYNNIKEALDDFKIPKLSRDVNTYRRYFLDIIINGNFRVKYISSCAARDTAENYCKKRLDEDGVPSYRLLPPNSQDPNNVLITDINGDKVDDVVIVDRMGFPVIVNGYKLVRASPYKKVYLTTHPSKESRKKEPFNEWVEKQMGKLSIDEIDQLENKIDWRSGKRTDIEPNATMKKYIEHYTDIGLGKPRVKKSISPNGLFASAFSRVWKYFWNHTEFVKVKKLTSYINFLKICNSVFLRLVELPVANEKFDGSYVKYMNAKNGIHKGEVNEALGKKVVAIIKDGIQKVFDEDGTLKVDNPGEFTRSTQHLIANLSGISLVFGLGLNNDFGMFDRLYDIDNQKIGSSTMINTIITKYKNELLKPSVSATDRKRYKDMINDRINRCIDKIWLGDKGLYLKLLERNKKRREDKEDKYEKEYNLYNVLFKKNNDIINESELDI